MSKYLKKFRLNNFGTSLVEFALIIPVLISLIFGGIEISNYLFFQKKVQRIAEQTALWLSAGISDNDIKDCLIGAQLILEDIGVKDQSFIKASGIVKKSGKPYCEWQKTYIGDVFTTSQTGKEPSDFKKTEISCDSLNACIYKQVIDEEAWENYKTQTFSSLETLGVPIINKQNINFPSPIQISQDQEQLIVVEIWSIYAPILEYASRFFSSFLVSGKGINYYRHLTKDFTNVS